MTALSPGKVLASRFELVGLLGRGGMGQVWLGRDLDLDERVALKVLDPGLTEDPSIHQLLRRECRQARRLVHPNIVRVFDFHEHAQLAFISMEYVEGGELGQLRDAAPADILRAVIPLADALAYAHGQGIVHRDLKPSNVLLDREGQPRLLDFGIAGALGEANGLRVSGGGSRLSASPEQRAGRPPSPADDAFGFGVLLYELLSGFPPRVSAERAPEAVRSRMNHPIPERLSRLVAGLLAWEADRRQTDMAAVSRDLTEIRRELLTGSVAGQVQVLRPSTANEAIMPVTPLPATPAAAGIATAPSVVTGRRGPGRSLLWSAFAVMVVLLIGVVFLLPGYVAKRQPEAAAVPVNAAPPEEIDFAKLAAEKRDAERAAETYETRRLFLTERGAETWATADLRDITTAAEAAQQLYDSGEFAAARDAWQAAVARLEELEGRIGGLLATALERGQGALDGGRGADAEQEFEFALILEPGNEVAALGLQRAATIERVFALLNEGRRLEAADQLREARSRFAQAADLDPLVEAGAAGVARIDARLVEQVYTDAMSRGYAALGAEDFAAALRAFQSAARIRPQAADAAAGIAQAEAGERLATIEREMSRATELEKLESWQAAAEAYGAVLAIDAGITLAAEGLERTTGRARLDATLEDYLTRPERLYSPEVQQAARSTLAQAAQITRPGPRLRAQIDRLQTVLTDLNQPVQVVLESDNLTEIVVYRVGRLGTFERMRLELKPGDYTVVGSRAGYRDVRREIRIRPGDPPGLVSIRCEEPI
jgi:tetratricopeptide (TPR) repeat protein